MLESSLDSTWSAIKKSPLQLSRNSFFIVGWSGEVKSEQLHKCEHKSIEGTHFGSWMWKTWLCNVNWRGLPKWFISVRRALLTTVLRFNYGFHIITFWLGFGWENDVWCRGNASFVSTWNIFVHTFHIFFHDFDSMTPKSYIFDHVRVPQHFLSQLPTA